MRTLLFIAVLGYIFYSCQGGEKELTEQEKAVQDSLSKARQKRVSASLKKLNPLLILPPDSEYTGDYIDKYPNGIVKYRGYFRFGQRHGQWVSFYNSGIPWSEQHYDKGLRHGPNIVYYENSKIRYAGNYKNDKRDSIWTFYDSVGTKIKEILYKEDKELPMPKHP